MRRFLLLVGLAACGPKPSTTPPTPDPATVRGDGLAPTPRIALVGIRGEWAPIACPGEVEGVGGGRSCLVHVPPEAPANGLGLGSLVDCAEPTGPLRGVVFDNLEARKPAPLELAGTDVRAVETPRTDPRDKREHLVDLDGDGDPETITLIPHDNRASYGRSLSIVDGHDPLMIDTFDPFPDAADLVLLGTSDVDADGRRELILHAPGEEVFGIAVQEYWAPTEAYRVECRNS